MDLKWYCLRTQTKREKLAAAKLRVIEGVEVFCPILRYRKSTRRGKIWWEEALFPGYVLCRFDLDQHMRYVDFSQGVRGLIKFGNSVPHMPNWFMDMLIKDWNSQADTEVLTLKPQIELGDEVELATGPLQGMKGVIVDIRPGAERIKVLLEFLGQEQAVDCDLFDILLPRKPVPEM